MRIFGKGWIQQCWPTSDTHGIPGRLSLAIFLAFAGLYGLTMSGHLHTVDSYHVYEVTRSLAEEGNTTIPRGFMAVRGVDGSYYAKFGVGQSLMVAPLYALGSLLEQIMPPQYQEEVALALARTRSKQGKVGIRPQHLRFNPDAPPNVVHVLAALAFNPLVTAATLALFFLLLTRLGYSATPALFTTLVLGLSTLCWPLSRDFFQHPVIMLFLLLSFCLAAVPGRKMGGATYLVLGLIGAAAILTRNFTLVWVPVFCVFFLFRLARRNAGVGEMARCLGAYVSPILLAITIQLLLNNARFGGPLKTGYHTLYDQDFFGTPLWAGLHWNLFTSHRGLLFFAAPAILSIFVGRSFFRRQGNELGILIAVFVAIYLIFYSKWWAFHGGWCIGPRFLLPIIPLLMLPVVEIFLIQSRMGRVLRWTLGALALAGAFVQLVFMSVEYTTVHELYSLDYSLVDVVNLLLQGGQRGLDYFFVAMAGQLNPFWYGVFLLPPLLSLGAGVWIGSSYLWATKRVGEN